MIKKEKKKKEEEDTNHVMSTIFLDFNFSIVLFSLL
jgi:hypothetical protein